MNMVEAGAVIFLWIMLIGWVTERELQRAEELGLAPIAEGMAELEHELEAYAEKRYGALWRCLDADSLADGGVSREVDVPVFRFRNAAGRFLLRAGTGPGGWRCRDGRHLRKR